MIYQDAWHAGGCVEQTTELRVGIAWKWLAWCIQYKEILTELTHADLKFENCLHQQKTIQKRKQ